MKKLTKTQVKERDTHGTALNDAFGALESAIAKYNEAVTAAKGPLEAAITDYNNAIEAATSFRDDVVSEMDSYASERSDKWQESDAAQAFMDWKSEWENLELELFEFDDPVELEPPATNPQEDLEALPEEVS